jgi:hypothetical protein
VRSKIVPRPAGISIVSRCCFEAIAAYALPSTT